MEFFCADLVRTQWYLRQLVRNSIKMVKKRTLCDVSLFALLRKLSKKCDDGDDVTSLHKTNLWGLSSCLYWMENSLGDLWTQSTHRHCDDCGRGQVVNEWGRISNQLDRTPLRVYENVWCSFSKLLPDVLAKNRNRKSHQQKYLFSAKVFFEIHATTQNNHFLLF